MTSPKILLRNGALRLASALSPRGDDPLPDFAALKRVLLVYVNWRLGNNLLVTPAVGAFTEAFPAVHFDFLGGPFAPPVLDGYRLGRVTEIGRRHVFSPPHLVSLVRRLRREAYDAVVHLHSSTGTIGAFFTGMSKAPVRIGCRRPGGNVYFTSTVAMPTALHKVDRMNEYLASLGVPSRREREMRIRPEEAASAEALLSERTAAPRASRVAIFLSGRQRKSKAWDLDFYAEVLRALRARNVTPVVVLGPEERGREEEVGRALGDAVYVSRLPIRAVAAIVQRCGAAVSPDSGPMHLAVAVGTPTVALFRARDFDQWGPREPLGRVVFDPAGRDVEGTLAALDAVRLGRRSS